MSSPDGTGTDRETGDRKALAQVMDSLGIVYVRKDGPLVITGRMTSGPEARDEDLLPRPEDIGQAAAEEMRDRLARGDFEYAGLDVDVAWDGAVIGSDCLGRVEHGEIGGGIVADAGLLESGSPLADVIGEALDQARKWARAHGSPAMLEALDRAAGLPELGNDR